MKKTKSTKHSLLLSALALLMCVSMLIGSTFAWFTDSVTSGNNKIVAGNLDIELEYYNGTDWKTVNNATDLFTGNLWEPGHTEVVYLKLSNPGSLALKYQLGININSETLGTNVAGEPFQLSDYIYMGVVEGKQPSYTDRETAVAAVAGNCGIIGNGYTKAGTMTADAEDLYLAVVVYMPETVGNEANYLTGTAAPEINLGINLMATQLTYEKDGFDDEYDKDAGMAVYTATDLQAAINAGENVKLMDDIKLTESIVIPASAASTMSLRSAPVATVIDLNGKTISGSLTDGAVIVNNGIVNIIGGMVKSTATNGKAAIQNNGIMKLDNVTVEGAPSDISIGNASYAVNTAGTGTELILNNTNISGRGTIGATNGTKVVVNGGTYHTPAVAWGHAIYANGEGTEVVINGGTFSEGYDYAADLWGMYQIYSGNKAKVIVNGGDFSQEWDCANGYDLCTATEGTITIYGGSFAENPTNQNNINYVADGYVATKNADGTYTVVKGATVANAADLQAALAAGGNIVLTDDIELTSTLMVKKDVVIDLNGNTITAPSNGNMFQSSSDTEPSIIITSSTAGAEINVSGGDTSVLLGYGSTEIKNVTINVKGCDNYSPNPFNANGDLTLGEGTVVNIDYLGTSLINNNGAHAIVIDGAKINVGTFKANSPVIYLNQASTLEIKNTEIKIEKFVLSQFGGECLVKKVDGVAIEGCTFNVTDSNGASCTFVADAELGRYDLVQN